MALVDFRIGQRDETTILFTSSTPPDATYRLPVIPVGDMIPPEIMKFTGFQKALGRRLRALREEAGLTQEKAARKARITRQHLQRIEGGKANPQAKTLFELSRACGSTMESIVAFTRGGHSG